MHRQRVIFPHARHNRTSALLVVLLLLIWAGCSDNQMLAPEDDTKASSRIAVSPEVQAAMNVQDRHTDDLLKRPGIVGVGTGILSSGKPAIVVYALTPEHARKAKLPSHVDGVPVRVEITGMFVARADPTSRFSRPVPIGVSTGHPDITAGTIGCRVKDASGNVYVLSNNHVLANSNEANIGDSALQPGPYDGGTDPADKIGELHDFEPMDFSGGTNYIDAAIALSSTDNLGYATPSGDGYGTPSATIYDLDGNNDGAVDDAVIGLNVQKYGRTTGHTLGTVAEINVTVNVCYQCNGPFCFSCSKLATFEDQISITPGDFSAGGDSGSLIVTDDGNANPVGLLFAGSDTRTLANRIDLVLDRFNVTVDDGSGGGTTNSPPTASFTYSCTDLSCNFDGAGSTDSDGSISSYAWDFGDGNTGSGTTVSHTYGADGTYTVTLTVTDDDGATDSQSQNVSVSSSSDTGGTMHLGDLVGTKNVKGRSGKWEAIVTATIHDDSHNPVANATVSGTWSGDVTGTVSGTTGSDGTVTFTSGNIDGSGSVTFTVDDVTHSTLTYDSSTNDVGTSVTVSH